MDPALIALVGMLLGLSLLVAEFFVPSGGMIFLGACACLLIGVWGAWKAWGVSDFSVFLGYIAMLFVLIPGAIGGGLYLLQNTSLGDRVLLKAPDPEEVSPYAKEVERLRKLIGRRGRTVGLLHPAGMVEVDGERYHCASTGMMVDPNTEVEIIDVDGTRLVVRVPFETETRQDETVETSSKPADTAAESFDFDVPDENEPEAV